VTGTYAPEEPEFDPDHEPDPDAVFYEPEETRPEDRRDPPPDAGDAQARGLAWLRKIRAENNLPTGIKIRSGRDM
jgi:hypothetical protein